MISVDLENDDFYILKLDIKGGTEKFSKMKAKLELLYSWSGVFHDWRIEFDNCIIDKLTTASWFKGNNTKYKIRESLFNFIEIGKQGIRKNKRESELHELSPMQLKLLSDFFNDNEKYNSTIYNIITFLKGSNPSGAYKNARASQIWECSTNNEYNIHIFLKCFIVKKSPYSRGKKENALAWDKAEKSNWVENIEGYLNEPERERLKKIFYQLNQNNSQKNILQIAKSESKKLAEDLIKHTKEIDEKAKKERGNYIRNIMNEFGSLSNAFEKCWNIEANEKASIDRSHIVPVSYVKKQLLNNWENKEKREGLFHKISDPYNFLPIDKICHYDGYDSLPRKLYWNSLGELIIIDELFYKYNESQFRNYQKISPDYLSKCKCYLEEINHHCNL